VRWIYVLFTLVPVFGGMLTTFTLLSVLVGPPVIVVSPQEFPAELYVVSSVASYEGSNIYVRLTLSNRGGEDLVVKYITFRGVEVAKPELTIPPGGVDTIEFLIRREILPRGTQLTTLEIKIFWYSKLNSDRIHTEYITITRR